MDPNQQIFKPAVGRSHWTRSVFEAQVYISKYKVGGERMPGHWCWACDHRSTCEFPGGNHCHKGSSDESLSQIHDNGFGQHQHTCPDFRSKATSATGVDIRTRQHASCCSRCGVLYLEKPTIQWPRSDYPWGPSSIEQWPPFRSDWQDLERPCSEIGFATVRGYGSIDQSSVVICQWSMANGSVNGSVCSTSTTCWGFAVSFTHLTTQFAKSGQNKWQLFGHLVNIQALSDCQGCGISYDELSQFDLYSIYPLLEVTFWIQYMCHQGKLWIFDNICMNVTFWSNKIKQDQTGL